MSFLAIFWLFFVVVFFTFFFRTSFFFLTFKYLKKNIAIDAEYLQDTYSDEKEVSNLECPYSQEWFWFPLFILGGVTNDDKGVSKRQKKKKQF